MNPIQAVIGLFQSPILHAAAWGFVSTFLLCVVLVITKRWHGALTMDFTDGVQKFHTAPIGHHAGVIVLGGATQHPGIYQAHGQVPLGEAAERMTVPVGLMRQYPKLQLVFSGGEGRLLATGVSEAELAKAFYEEQGLDMSRVKLEGGSRTTRENARQVAALLGEHCKQPWLLVTSAWHMPRSVPEFEAVGCQVTPYPVDFRTGDATPWTEYSLARSLLLWQTALHEWLGLGVYRVTR